MDRRLGKKLADWADQSSASGMKFDVGTYVGIVKINADPLRLGRLKVWLPDGGGDEDNPKNWRWVTYASPYYGSTFNSQRTRENSYAQSETTYGMWLVPPDIGNEVLCTFVNGDPGRGYWFACTTTTNLSHAAVPGVAAKFGDDVESDAIVDSVVRSSFSRADLKSYLPSAEFNEDRESNLTGTFFRNPFPINETQAKILINQGLDTDPIRGAIGSSSMRDAPSSVFGISTPGRSLTDDNDGATKLRKGGHSFVMDDGANDGSDQLIRLRTASGHQLLMNDAEQVVYIANANGMSWLEFGSAGQITMYSTKGVAVRSQGSLNFHSDEDMNFQARNINMRALEEFNTTSNSFVTKSFNDLTLYSAKIDVGSSGAITVKGASDVGIGSDSTLTLKGSHISINDGSVAAVPDPGEIKFNNLPDTSKNGSGLWVVDSDALKTIVTVAPTHEPYQRGATPIQAGDVSIQTRKSVCEDPTAIPSKQKAIPPGGGGPFAAYIASHESGSAGYNAFNRGSNPPAKTGTVGGETINLTSMTIAEILSQRASNQADPYKRLFAVGRYQMIPDTLQAAAKQLDIPLGTKFSPDVQDNMFVNYLCAKKQPKIGKYLTGSDQNDDAALLNACSATAAEWASIEDPMLSPPRGRYDGVGTNRAHGKTPQTIEALKKQWEFLKQQSTGNAVTTSSGQTLTDGSGNPITTGTESPDKGIAQSVGKDPAKKAPAEYMKREDTPSTGLIVNSYSGTPGTPDFIPGLDYTQAKALMVELAYSYTDFNKEFSEENAVGRYAVNGIILANFEYIKPDYLKTYGKSALSKDAAWTGKDNINSLADFLRSSAIQDKVMSLFISDIYLKLAKATPKAIEGGDNPCTIAGMISVAYFFKDSTSFLLSDLWAMANKAGTWRKENTNVTINSRTPADAYNEGRYAIDILSTGTANAATESSAADTTGGQPSGSGVEPAKVITFTTGSGDMAHYMQLPAAMRKNFELMAQEFQEKVGRKITLSSAYRSLDEQQAIYDAWVKAGGTATNPRAGGYYMPSKPNPNSPHPRKVALDIGRADIADLNNFGLLRKYGFKFPFPENDPVHIQIA